MARILYLGDSSKSSTSGQRAQALVRLGHEVLVRDTEKAARDIRHFNLLYPLHFRTGFRLIQKQMSRWVRQSIDGLSNLDFIWVNGGELLGKNCLEVLQRMSCPIILYNNDDPTGGRDGARFDSLLSSISYYDMCVVMRDLNTDEFLKLGAKSVKRVFMSYDEVAHCPYISRLDIPKKYLSEVIFIGSWMRNERRDEFLLKLIKLGVPLGIWGGRWEKSRFWPELKKVYKGGPLSGEEYVAAIQGSKICLGLLSKGNRDLHTQRSLEIPYSGGLLCAERTVEHLQMYREGTEAFFWSSVEECADVCKMLLANAEVRENARLAGMRRVRLNQVGNETVCRTILKELTSHK